MASADRLSSSTARGGTAASAGSGHFVLVPSGTISKLVALVPFAPVIVAPALR